MQVIKFFKEVKIEAKRVSWPSLKETMVITAVVGFAVAVSSLFFLLADYLFYGFIEFFLNFGGI